MNTPIPTARQTSSAVSAPEQLSALCDGSIGAVELDVLMAECRDDPQSLERWHAYQVIGAALRGSEPTVCAHAPADFLESLRSRLADETPRPSVVQVGTLPRAAAQTGAANDSVFRWKLVAGFASVAAVAAVGWNLLATLPGTAGAGAQLAQSTPVVPVTSVAVGAPVASQASAAQTVAVDTRQGTVIRDVGLERLLAEHRQHGGMSALQNPTGFIRNATYDADAR